MTFIRWQPFTIRRRKKRQLHYAGLARAPGSIQRQFMLLLFFLFSDTTREQSVFVMLNGEESELCFVNLANPKVRHNRFSSPLTACYQ
jgi:hypothetical protein